ncbi:ubiquitin carboxyl-terminal hydrolase 31 [Maylandia zebra]|uniref:ubiquitinyl hydrolase 1 n=1 Tax=Astatotilapia calliptera TaxID=8154 RepID=A0A3P8PBF5_ASTCA|nr:ubiquitin carboxyl-terminal hydrolase 31 [Maylandia zebra]XP_026034499.1 ubiquitin carboxyl-terminal hydrolase 31-like [Astatotilapia calliptera]
MSKVVSNKEKKSFSKKLFRRSSVRSVGSFMSRVLRTLSTLSHFGTDEQAAEDETDEATLLPNTTGGSLPSDDSDCGGFPFGDKVPGVAGLKNHGNTCFMNAILQCLSNTELFAEYLALEQFKGGETTSNNEKAKSNGVLMQKKGGGQQQPETGEVTEQLSGLVRALWTFEYTPQHSRDFKNVVSKSALQFKGNSQHDAQEFLLWLLDRVHEDLNQIVPLDSRLPRKPPVEEETVPEGSPLPAPGSFVQELFQAQYRSSLTCPHCQKQSNTFDPFLCISLPIPVPHTRPLYVTVVYQGKCSHCMRVGVAVPLSGTVSRLRQAVAQETKIPAQQIVLTEMYYDGFHRSFCDDDDDLEIIQESDSIFAFETPELFRPEQIRSKRCGSPHANLNQNNLKYGTDNNRMATQIQEPTTPPQSPNKNSGQAEKIVLLVCNRACAGQQGRRFGNPFILYLERTVTWDVLQKEILEKMRHVLRPGVFVQVGPFTLRVVGVVGITYLLPQEEQPLCHPSVERAYKSCGPGGPPHVKIVVEWDKETKDYLFKRTEDEYIPDAESVRQAKEQHLQPQTCSLAQCFQLYTKEEQLAPDDAWRCPHCKQLQQGSIKLSLWTLPDILILHLKRFRQDGDRRMKMQNMVKFPLTGMDMAPHMVKRSQSSWSLPSHWSPWRRPYGMGRDPEDYLYDLYAVCNHHGTMQGGHYTAHCKNSIDGQWYCFDDSDVHPISEDEVCKQTAYILFYQRRATIPSWSANSSVGGSTSSSLCEHWISRLIGSRPPSQASSGSSRRTSLASLSESAEFAGERSEDDGLSSRPAVRGMQRQTFSSRSSIASPLALSENGAKPSWPHSAKLQLRSNSPSRFSLESHSSSPVLERIGEVVDTKQSTSCFTGSPKLDKLSGGKSAIGALESNGGAKRLIEQVHSKAVLQADQRSSIQAGDNNNLLAGAEQVSPRHGAAAKEVKPRTVAVDSSGVKRSSAKTGLESEKSPKKRAATSSTSSSSLSPASPAIDKSQSRTQSKSAAAPSTPKDKSDGSTKICKGGSSRTATPSKKGSSQTTEVLHPELAAQKKSGSPGLQNSHPQRRTSPRGVSEKSSASGRNRAADRSTSRESSRTNTALEKKVSHGGPPSRLSAASRAEGRPGKAMEDRAAARSSSSSSSITSLRSSSVGVSSLNTAPPLRGPQRSSKTEDKGLSFFKTALRPKETRKPSDSGKAGAGEGKGSPEESGGSASREGVPHGASKKTLCVASESNASTAKDKESSKASSSAKHSLLPSTKSKLSGAETAAQSPATAKDPSKKEPAKKTLQSRKIPINSTQTSQKSK